MAGNQQPNQTSGFTWDRTEPTSIVSFPADGAFLKQGALTTISGTADDLFDVQKVEVSIQRLSDNKWWDTSIDDWSTSASPLYIETAATIEPPAGVHPRPWNLTADLPTNALTFNDQYRIQARATDVPGNVQQTIATGVTFRYDINAPTVGTFYPVNNQLYRSIVIASGTAQDNFNTKQVQIRIKNEAAEYWDANGSAYVPSANTWNVATGTSATGSLVNWTFTSLPGWDPQTYEMNVRALDEAGNFTVNYATVTFTYDATPPVTVSTFPVSGTTYRQMARLYGTAEDGVLPRDISEVRVKIYRVIAGATTYWDGLGNWTGTETYNLVSNRNSQGSGLYYWDYSHARFSTPPLAWTSGTTYYIVSRAIDLAGNVYVEASTKTFVFDNAAPMSAFSLPADNRAYRPQALALLTGTANDVTSTVTNVQFSIFDETTSQYFDGSGFGSGDEVFLDATLFSSSWTYSSGFLTFLDDHHYVFKSSATDSIGNVEVPTITNRILVDEESPTSSIATPANGATEDDTRTIFGNYSDPGTGAGINGTGSGVRNTLGWHQGKVQVLVARFESSNGAGPFSFGTWAPTDYFWSGSSWSVISSYGATPPWQDVTVNSDGTWIYNGLVNNWVKGKFYIAWVRAIDNAGNLETPGTGPQFQIAASAAQFIVTGLTDGQQAGVNQTITVEAVDSQGFRATAFQSTVTFIAQNGNESMDTDNTVDDNFGLPKQYKFTLADAGIHTFTNQVRFRKAGTRSVRAEANNGVIFGSHAPITVLPTTIDRLLVVPQGQTEAPGESPSEDGVTGSPAPITAGNSFAAKVWAVDKYWNATPSSSPVVTVVTSDPYDVNPGTYTLNNASATISILMTTRGAHTITASGAGTPNTSAAITINPKSADRLLALLPGQSLQEGQYLTPPYGKTGTVPQIYAGQAITVSVYGVDEYYNTNTSMANTAVYTDLPNDAYDVTPSSLTLISGTTEFTLTPVTAGTQVVRSTANLANGTYNSDNFTVLPDTTAGQIQLQLLFSGETPDPGRPPYGQPRGGKTGTPNAQYAGLGATVTIRLVDQYYNLIQTGANMPTVTSTTTDINDGDFDSQQVTLVNGVAQTTITFVTQNNPWSPTINPTRDRKGWQVTVRDNASNYALDASTWVVTWPNDAVKLRVMAPGETYQEGSLPSGTGKSGTPNQATVGMAYPVTVQATDNYWNRNLGRGPAHNTGIGQQVDIESNDVYAVSHSTLPLTEGERQFSNFEPRTAQSGLSIWAYDAQGATDLATQTISGIVVVATSPAKYQILMPGESAVPGSVAGKINSPSAQTAGAFISPIEVRLTDAHWNPIKTLSGAAPWVSLSTPNAVDKYAILPSSKQMTNPGGNGYKFTFNNSVQFLTAGTLNHNLTAEDPAGLYTGQTSPAFTVNAAALNGLQILMPGETADPGRPLNYAGSGLPAGNSGVPDADGNNTVDTGPVFDGVIDQFAAGDNYPIVVHGVDAYHNVVSTDATVSLISTDLNGRPNTVTPMTATLVNGTTGYSVRFLTAQNSDADPVAHTLTASAFGLASDDTPTLNVMPNTSSRVQILLPGEIAAPGTSTGKTGTPAPAMAGYNYNGATPITVRLTDNYFNAVGHQTQNVPLQMTTTDPSDTPDPDNTQTINSGLTSFDATFTHQFRVATSTGWYVTVSTRSGPAYVTDVAGPITVNADSTTVNSQNILILLPGERYVPGKTTAPAGRDNAFPPDFTTVLGHAVPLAGEAFPVTVLAVDRFYNRIFDPANPLVRISANSELYPTFSADTFSLANGSATVNVTLRRSTNTATLMVAEEPPAEGVEYSTGTSTTFSVDANAAAQLQVLLPGETAVPGSATGKTGTPDADGNNAANGDAIAGAIDDFVAGNLYPVTVRAVDAHYNLVSVAPTVDLTITDPYDTPSSISQPLFAGSTVYTVRFFTANATGWRVNVSTSFGVFLANGQSSLAPVRANTATRFVVTVPGESHVPGNVAASGKSGSPAGAAPGTYVAGNIWIATVTATDNWYNPVTTAVGNAVFTTSDTFDVEGTTLPLVNGTTSFPIQMVTAGSQTLTIFERDGNYIGSSVGSIPITAGAANRVIVILPGESFVPGKPPYTAGSGAGGKAATSPSNQVAGTSFLVNVYATDAYWNLANSALTVSLAAPNDPNPLGTGSADLVSGATSYNVTLFKAVNYSGFAQTITANVAGLTNPDYTSANVTVLPDTVGGRKVRMLLPNQVAEPGTVAGKSGTPNSGSGDGHFTAGQTVSIRVDGTDTWGNILNVVSTVTVTTNDPYDSNDPHLAPLINGTSTFSHIFVTERTGDSGEVTSPAFTTLTAASTGYTQQIDTVVVDDDASVRRLQILVQGETAVPGNGIWPNGGKSGTPDGDLNSGGANDNFIAGSTFAVTVRLVDNNNNLVENPAGGAPTITLQSNDTYITNPLVSGAGMTNGVLTQAISLRTKNLGSGWVVIASGSAGGFAFSPSTSSAIKVDAGAMTRLQILVPGESPVTGSTTGKIGSPSTQVAGSTFTLPAGWVRAVDQFYNSVSTNGVVTISLKDPYGSLSPASFALASGENASAVSLSLAVSTDTMSQEIYVSGLGLAKSTSTAIPVNPNTATKLLILVPGEVHVPGDVINRGKSGSAASASAGTYTAGAVFSATVTAVDNWYNTVSTATGDAVFATSDPYDVEGATLPLVNGTTSFAVQMFQAGTQTLGIYESAAGLSSSTVNNIPITAGAANRVLVILPGETYRPGKPPYAVANTSGGKATGGTPSNQTAGTAFPVAVYTTDSYWNTATSGLTAVLSAPADPNPAGTGSATLSGGTTGYSVTLFKAVNYSGFSQTLTANVAGLTDPDYTTPALTVMPDTAGARKIRLMLPGESPNPGTVAGKTGSPNSGTGDGHFTAGQPVTATVQGTDTWGNLLNVGSTVSITTNDTFDGEDPRFATLVNGTSNFSHIFVTERTSDVGEVTSPAFTTISASTNGYTSQSVNLVVDDDASVRKLQILVQGETYVPGSGTWPTGGKSGTPDGDTGSGGANDNFIAGTNFTVTVRSVDNNNNLVEVPGNPQITLQSDDPFVTNPIITGAPMINGVLTQSISLRTKNLTTGWVVIASGSAGGFTYSPSTSAALKVDAGVLNALQILVPGETPVPGSVSGKSGSPLTQTVNATFALSSGNIRAVDQFFNTVSTNGQVTVSLKDPYGTVTPAAPFALSNGINGTAVLVNLAISTDTLSPQEIYVSGLGVSKATSSAIAVNPSTATQLQILAEGETAVPGSPTGKSGTPDQATAGDAYTFVINMTDVKFNRIPGATQPTVRLVTSTSAFATTSPTQATLNDGTASIDMTFQRASATGWIVQAATAAGSALPNIVAGNSPAIVVLSTTTDRLQLVLPGQTAVPGLIANGAKGIVGNPSPVAAGSNYVVTVNLTDRFYNVKTDLTPAVIVETADLYDTHPATRTILNGTTSYTVVFHTAPGPWTIKASTSPGYSGSALDQFISSAVTVTPGPATKLQVLMPGEVAVPGKPPYDSGQLGGKSGVPDIDDNNGNGVQPFVAGTDFNVKVNLVDQFFNRSTSENTFVRLVASDPFDAVAALGSKQTGAGGDLPGQATFTGVTLVTQNTAPGWQITASTATGDNYANGVSTWVPVTAGAVQRLLVLAPGETPEAGNPIGKSDDIPNAQIAGSTFTVTVSAVDAHFNVVTTTDTLVALTFVGNSDGTLDDSHAQTTRPAAKNLISGTTTFDVFLVTAENKETVIIATAPSLTNGYSGEIPMNPGVTEKYQLVLPGQTVVPGSYLNNARGLTGQPDIDGNNADGAEPFIAGTTLTVTVRSVDAYWNKTNDSPVNMSLTSNDPNDLNDPRSLTLNSGTTNVNWIFNTSSSTGWTMTVADSGGAYSSFISTTIPVLPGTARKLQVLLPGETAAPGTSTGKTGTPSAWTAGITTSVVVNIVDDNWNIVPTALSTQVRLYSNTDMFASTQTLSLVNGTTTFSFVVYTASAASTLTAVRMSGQSLDFPTANSASYTINAASSTRLQILIAGETAVPGRPPYDGTGGRLGQPDYNLNPADGQTPFPAGANIPVTVRAVDNFYNLVQPGARVQLATQDPYDPAIAPQQLAAGATVFNIFMHTKNLTPGWTITASTTSDSATSLLPNTSPAVPVTFGAAAKLQILLPGETAVPGSSLAGANGKTGTPQVSTAGVQYDVDVQLTDAFYNVVTDISMPSVQLTSTDPWDDEDNYSGGNNRALDPSTGKATFGVFFNTSSSWTLTASDDASGNLYTNDISTWILVTPNLANRMLVVMPGETHTPGKTSAPFGKTGTPSNVVAGENVAVRVLITDSFYNIVSTAQAPLTVATNDPYDTDPGNFSAVQGEINISTVNLRIARNTTVITVTDNDPLPPVLTSGNSANFIVQPATASKLQLVLPGETAQPGNLTLPRGVTGTPNTALAGVGMPVQVRITDNFWNVTGASSTLRMTSTDPSDQSTGPWVGQGLDPYDFTVTTGAITVNFPLITLSTNGWTLTTSDSDDNPSPYPLRFTNATSAAVPVISGPVAKLITILPGETLAPGSVNGKTGTVRVSTAGVEIDVNVYTTDQFNNLVTVPPAGAGSNAGDIRISVENNTDPYLTVNPSTKPVSGATGLSSFQMTLVKAGTHTIAADDITVTHGVPWTRSVSSLLTVNPAPAEHLLVLMPGESARPGMGAPGKIGTPTDQVAGATFPVTVQIVDDYYNPQPVHPNEQLRLDTSDLYDVHPATALFSNGLHTDTFVVTLRTAGNNHTLTAVDTNLDDAGTTFTSSVSPISGAFNVSPSTASRFLVLFPGETFVPGSATGKTGAPSNQVAGVAFNLVLKMTDEQFNLINTGTMPQIVMTSNDPLEQYVTANPNTLSNGERTVTMIAKTAQTNFTLSVSTTVTSPSGTEYLKRGSASGMRVWPAVAHHYRFYDTPLSSVTAGDPFSMSLSVRDAFDNIISTGPNLYTGIVRFSAESTANGDFTNTAQNPVLPPNYTFTLADAGIKVFNGAPQGNFILKKAGQRWVRANDTVSSIISSERVSSGPVVGVAAGAAFGFTIEEPVDAIDNATDGLISVSAGNLSNPGKVKIVAQLADQYDNKVSSAGHRVDFSVFNVLGATGSVKWFDGSLYNTITTTATDANGKVGVDPLFYYFVSTKAADSAQVRLSSGAIRGDTLPILTRGGTPSQLAFVNAPVSAEVGVWVSNQFTVERRDDFGNPTSESPSSADLKLPVAQGNAHSSDLKTYYFTDPNDQNTIITGLAFDIGESQKSFSFYDTMSSTPAVEDNRPGTWQVRVEGAAPLPTITHELLMNPGPTSMIGVDNPKRNVEAGKITYQGNVQEFQFELWDSLGNPTIATETVRVVFESTRTPSTTLDNFGFVTSSQSTTIPGLLANTTSGLLISSGTYQTRFWYFDTHSSESYGVLASSRPIIGGQTVGRSWRTQNHYVNVLPTFDADNRIAITSTSPVFGAGSTTTVRTMQLQDKYSNPTAVISGWEDTPGQGVAFNLVSTSTGDVKFASPSSTTFVSGNGTARLMLGQHTTTFYLTDTLAGVHTLTIQETNPRTWDVATQTYTVLAGEPTRIVFDTPIRKLIAGTTNTYDVTVSSPYIRVQTRDNFNNKAPVLGTEFIDIFSDSPLGQASVTPQDANSFTSIAGSNGLTLTFTPGEFQREFYYRDQITGHPVLSAVDQGLTLNTTAQTATITPNRADRLTLHHSFSLASPLSVRNEGVITVIARDTFNNPADGGASIGENNGLTYSGTVMLAHTGSTGAVTISGDNVGVSTLTMTSAMDSFTVRDIIQETLALYATDYAFPIINGRTGFGLSNGDVTTTGLVVTPTDLAPEPPSPSRPLNKSAVVPALFQGDGTTLDNPDPVVMMMLRMEVKPAGVTTSSAWLGLRVKKQGSIPNEDVAEIALWQDMNKDGELDLTEDGNGVITGTPIATGTFANIAGADQVDLSFAGASSQTLTAIHKQYFLTVRIGTSASEGTNLGFLIEDSGAFVIPPASTAKIAENNFPMSTYLSDIQKTPAPVLAKIENIAAFYDGSLNATVPQGNPAVGYLRLKFWTREFQATLDKIRVTRLGTASDLDVTNVRLYMDGTDGTNGEGIFQPNADTLVNSTVMQFSTSAAVLDINPNILLNGTTKTFFIAMALADSAQIGATLGVRIPSRTDILLLSDGDMVDSLADPSTQAFPVASNTPVIVPTDDNLIINPVPVAPAAATQGTLNVPVVRLDMRSSDHSVIWQGLRLDRKNENQVNRAEDVSEVKVWYDVDGSTTLDTTVDQLVTPLGDPVKFRSTIVTTDMSALSTNMLVQSVDKFAPAPGKLVIEDNLGNREVVGYAAINAVANSFEGLTRGLEGTTPVPHTVGAKVDGQAYLQILGALNGQEITENLAYKPTSILTATMNTSTGPLTISVANTTEFPPSGTLTIGSEIGISYSGKTANSLTGVRRTAAVAHNSGEAVIGAGRNKSYFVTFDIDPLARPGRLAGQEMVLGLNISSSSYVVVGAPDLVSPVPSFNAEIGDIIEFADTVNVVSTDTTTGATLQQGTVNQPVLTLMLNTAQSEAYWTSVKVQSTGTAVPSDAVNLIKIWKDFDNNGVFSSANDVELASGTFGNTGLPNEALLNFATTPQMLVTPTRSIAQNISRRFFITYDIKSLATPEKTLGVLVNSPVDFTMVATPPNFDTVSSTGLPYRSVLRTVIPSPRTVTVNPTLLLSNEVGVNTIPTLDVNVSSFATTIPLLPDTLMLPTSGYVVLGSEVMFYPSKSAGALLNVQRGLSGTVAQAHTAGKKVGVSYTQGDLNTAFMKLLVSCDGFNVRWFQLKMNRFLPAGSIAGADADVRMIKVWRDNGNGTLDRDPITGTIPAGTEILVGQKALGTGLDAGGSASIDLNDSSIGSPGFAEITAVQTTYWVTVDVDPTAKFDNLLGLRIQSETSLVIGALTPNDAIHSVSNANIPIETPAVLVRPTIDTMRVFVEDIAPPSVFQAQKDVPMARINLKTNANTVVWKNLRVDLTSDNGAVSGDIALIKMFKDVGNDGIFNVNETSKDVTGAYINMISQGTEGFTDGVAVLNLDEQIITSAGVNPPGHNYFLAYDINAFARVGINVGALIATTDYFTIAVPDAVAFSGITPPVNTSRSNILEAVDTVTLAVQDSVKTKDENKGGTYQAAENVEMLRFNLTTDVSQANWTALRLERTGSSQDPAYASTGRNSFVKAIKIWRDANNNDSLEAASDELLSSPTTFNLLDENDRVKLIQLNNPVLISPSPRSFFVSYDIGEGAEAGGSVGLKLGDLSWVTVSAPNTVAPAIRLLPGTTTQSFPYSTSELPINAIRVSATGQSMAPTQIPQLSTGVPMMMLTMSTDRNHVTLRRLKLHQTGMIETNMVKGSGDITRVSVWRDDGNTVLEPSKDTLLGTMLLGATTDFVNGVANVTLNGNNGTVIDQTPVNFFVTVDVGNIALDNTSTQGHTFGLKLISFADFTFVPATAGEFSTNNYATMITNLTTILDDEAAIVPVVSLLPKIYSNPFGDGYPALDQNGLPAPREFDSNGIPLVDYDGDGTNDIVLDLATNMPGLDLDGDGLIEIDIDRNGVLDVDFNNDMTPDDVLPDQNGDGTPEIDLSSDDLPDFGYIPEKWSKETSKIFSRWPKLKNAAVSEYQIGLGMIATSNNVTDAQMPGGWFSAEAANHYEFTNLSLLAAEVTKLTEAVDRTVRPPFDLRVNSTAGFPPSGQINVGSEIMGYSSLNTDGTSFRITRRGEFYGTQRQDHFRSDTVSDLGYILRARARAGVANSYGAESAIKVYRVDISPPSVPAAPFSDQELSGKPSTNGVFSIKWNAVIDAQSGVRAFELQEREDNDPVWRTIRILPGNQLSYLVGNNDNPANPPKEPGHFYTYRVRAINQAGGTSEWSDASAAASTGFPEEAITKVTNYPNPVDTRQGPTQISYLLNEDSTVKITLFDLLGYTVREWNFEAGQNGGKAGPNVFPWDGTDRDQKKVAAGGYILRIEVVGQKGSTTVIRKIGILN